MYCARWKTYFWYLTSLLNTFISHVKTFLPKAWHNKPSPWEQGSKRVIEQQWGNMMQEALFQWDCSSVTNIFHAVVKCNSSSHCKRKKSREQSTAMCFMWNVHFPVAPLLHISERVSGLSRLWSGALPSLVAVPHRKSNATFLLFDLDCLFRLYRYVWSV